MKAMKYGGAYGLMVSGAENVMETRAQGNGM